MRGALSACGLSQIAACTQLEELGVVISPEVPTSIEVSFDAPGDGPAWVRVEGERGESRTIAATVSDGRAHATVVGLRGGSRVRLVGVVDGSDTHDAKLKTDEPPDGLRFDLLEADLSAAMTDGYVFMAVSSDAWSGVVAVDGEGEPVWWSPAPSGWQAASPRVTRDGLGLLYLLNDVGRTEEQQRLVRVELDGSRRQEWPVLRGHHMVEELPDGEFAWLSWDIRKISWRHPPDEDPVLSDRVLVGDGDSTPREIVSLFDDLGPAYLQCAHAWQGDHRLGRTVYEWTHADGLVYIPERNSFVVMARFIDALVEIDSDTGEVLWQVGGRHPTMRFSDPAAAFSHAHMSDAWATGVLVFDNGGHKGAPARVVEYAFDAEGRSFEAVWAYTSPTGERIGFLGDARRLPNDDRLVAWSTDGRIDEISPESRRVWSVRVGPDDVVAGRIWFADAL